MSREQLHNLVECISEKDFKTVHEFLLQFVAYDFPYEDEIKAIEDYEKNKDQRLYTSEEVWGN